MSSLRYSNIGGTPGQQDGKTSGYSQAVVIGNVVKISGQGGWETDDSSNLPEDEELQIKNAFKNVERVLVGAGVKGGWDSVYSVRSYHVNMEASISPFVEHFRALTPNHQPIITAVGVPTLAIPGMRIEVEVEALLQ